MTRDPHDQEAISSLTARLQERDATEPADRTSPGIFAQEFITAMRSRGWRPTPARPPVDYRVTEKPADPDAVHRRADEIRAQIRRGTP